MVHRVRADPDGRRERHPEAADDREARVLGEHAEAELDVERPPAAPVGRAAAAHVLPVRLGAAEIVRGAPARLLRRHAGPHVLLRFHLQVEAELLVHARLGGAAGEEEPQAGEGAVEAAHRGSPGPEAGGRARRDCRACSGVRRIR